MYVFGADTCSESSCGGRRRGRFVRAEYWPRSAARDAHAVQKGATQKVVISCEVLLPVA